MAYEIKRSPLNDLEWHVYAPGYQGQIMLVNRVYEARPKWTLGRSKPVVSFSAINLAGDYLASWA